MSSISWATGPRITKALFDTNENQIYTNDFPPFATTNLATGGLSVEIVNAVLKLSNISATQSTLPLQSMIKFHLKQENALAIHGRNLNFKKIEKKNLVFIPLAISMENYVYYKASRKSVLGWDGKLISLKGATYGATKGENIQKLKSSGINVQTSRMHSLLKKLKSKKIDFISASNLNLAWMMDKHFPQDLDKFIALKDSNKENTIYIVFNKKHPNGKSIAKKFKSGLKKLIQNGQYDRILEKYIKEKSERKNHMDILTKKLISTK